MLFDFHTLSPQQRYKILLSTVVPRPIAWIVSQNAHGHLNAAPFSFFNAFGSNPAVIGIGIGSHEPGRAKDTRNNIRETRQFVVNVVSQEIAERMNITAIEFPPHTNELHQAGLTTAPSTFVKPPRIAESPASFECELFEIIDVGPESGLVLGKVLAAHIRDEFVLDAAKHYIDTPNLHLICRMHGSGWYARTSDLFEMPRIPLKQWTEKKS